MNGNPSMFQKILADVNWCPREVLDSTLELAIEIAREGREGRRIGTLFTLGCASAVMAESRALILDPVALHPREARSVMDPNLRGTMKELAQLDGAFVIDQDGTVIAACRYLDTVAKGVTVPFGLGSRHVAAASISKATGTIAIVVSESSVVRVFHGGALQAEILPELWLINRHSLFMRGPVHEDRVRDMAILTSQPSALPRGWHPTEDQG